MKPLLDRAITDKEKGMGSYNAVLEDDAREFLADISGGDARAALNALELGILTTKRERTERSILIWKLLLNVYRSG